MSIRRALSLLAVIGSVVACDKTPLVQPQDLQPKMEKPAAAPTPPPVQKDYAESQPGKSDPLCVGPLDPGTDEKLMLGGKPATLNGYKLTLGTTPGPVILGVAASLNDGTPENVKAFEAYAAIFKSKGAQAILVDGDTGDTEASIEASLKAFAKSGLPVLVLIGNREPKAAFTEATNAVHKEFANLINLNKVREVDFGGLTLLSLPGYHDPKYLIAGGDGCQYHSDDLAALKKLASTIKGPILLAAHGVPHQDGAVALDRTAAPAVNAGDPNLTELLADAHISFGVFANIIEAGGKATNLKGDQVVPAGTMVDSFFLNPGAADVTPWAMNDGTSVKGQVALLQFRDGKGSYLMIKGSGPMPSPIPAPAQAAAGGKPAAPAQAPMPAKPAAAK
jgi:hypothetical protein